MEPDKSLVRYIVGASRIKYDVLDKILLGHPDAAGVDFSRKFNMSVMFVDGYSILYRLYTEGDLSAVYADSSDELVRDLVVGFMNVLGHYRRYMSTRLHMRNDIICTFNMSVCKFQESLVPGYDQKHLTKLNVNNPKYGFINKAIRKAWKFIVSLSMYFEGIYCVDAQGLDDPTVWMTLSNLDRDNLYLILSRNPIAMQMLANSTQKVVNWYQIIPKRDDSRCVSRTDCIKNGYLWDHALVPHKGLGPEDLPYLWALGGCSYISLGPSKFARGTGTAARIVNRLVEETKTYPRNLSFQRFCTAIEPFIKKSAIELRANQESLRKRFTATNVLLTWKAVTGDQIHNAKTHMIDMFDQTGLEELNDILVRNCADTDPMLLELDNLNMSENN